MIPYYNQIFFLKKRKKRCLVNVTKKSMIQLWSCGMEARTLAAFPRWAVRPILCMERTSYLVKSALTADDQQTTFVDHKLSVLMINKSSFVL